MSARVFGRSPGEYVRFQRPFLIAITAAWAVRLALSLAGAPVAGVRFLSVTVVLALGALYYGAAVERRGFGSFRQLYALNVVQGVFSQTLVALAIVLAMAMGRDNIFRPAQGIGVLGLPLPPDGKSLAHAVEHVVVAGAIGFPIIGWLLGAVALLIARAVRAGRTAPSSAR
jgi:hypothetical protein